MADFTLDSDVAVHIRGLTDIKRAVELLHARVDKIVDGDLNPLIQDVHQKRESLAKEVEALKGRVYRTEMGRSNTENSIAGLTAAIKLADADIQNLENEVEALVLRSPTPQEETEMTITKKNPFTEALKGTGRIATGVMVTSAKQAASVKAGEALVGVARKHLQNTPVWHPALDTPTGDKVARVAIPLAISFATGLLIEHLSKGVAGLDDSITSCTTAEADANMPTIKKVKALSRVNEVCFFAMEGVTTEAMKDVMDIGLAMVGDITKLTAGIETLTAAIEDGE